MMICSSTKAASHRSVDSPSVPSVMPSRICGKYLAQKISMRASEMCRYRPRLKHSVVCLQCSGRLIEGLGSVLSREPRWKGFRVQRVEGRFLSREPRWKGQRFVRKQRWRRTCHVLDQLCARARKGGCCTFMLVEFWKRMTIFVMILNTATARMMLSHVPGIEDALCARGRRIW
jgi:hypothetical protein